MSSSALDKITVNSPSLRKDLLAGLPIFLFGFLGICAAYAVSDYLNRPLPEWMAYLNWKPGYAVHTFWAFSHLSAVPLTMFLLLFTRVTSYRSPLGTLVWVPWVLAAWFMASHDIDLARQYAYKQGYAKWECWRPESRECLLGKIERFQHLKKPKEPIVFTPKEVVARDQFLLFLSSAEGRQPPAGSIFSPNPEFLQWRKRYDQRVAEIFKDYPSIWKEELKPEERSS